MSDTTYLWLNDILPEVEPAFDGTYVSCERDVIEPALKAAGYTLFGGWFTGDGDSFGPLTRCVRTDQGIVVYG